METFDLVARADAIAVEAHRGQVDKLGVGYIEHPRAVSRRVEPERPDLIAAALLHDVIEDSEFTGADLRERGIPQAVIDVVHTVTRRDDQSPDDYYAEIACDPDATAVKLADLGENTDPRRLGQLPSETQAKLVVKYTKAFRALGRDDLVDELSSRWQHGAFRR